MCLVMTRFFGTLTNASGYFIANCLPYVPINNILISGSVGFSNSGTLLQASRVCNSTGATYITFQSNTGTTLTTTATENANIIFSIVYIIA